MADTNPTVQSFVLAVSELLEKFGQGPHWTIDEDSDGQLVINTGLTYTANATLKVMEGESHV